MQTDTPMPSTLQIMAQVDNALRLSGLATHYVERNPLPLFRQLLNELAAFHDVPVEIELQEQLLQLRQRLSERTVSGALRRVYEETTQLCRAHGSLTVVRQRELDACYRALLQMR